jgi:probable DNA repair protein
MGPGTEIDAWLRAGGIVVTASERASRALLAVFHRNRRGEGLSAWPAPNILNWRSFARAAWDERGADARLLLNPAQEQALWSRIAASSDHPAALLEGPRHRLAALAMEAHELVSAYAPRYLPAAARSGWQQDAAVFSGWLTEFDEACGAENLLSANRMPLKLIPLLQADSTQRAPLLVAGFDRILPVQRNLFDAWGLWREAAPGEPARAPRFHQAADSQAELAACALWCKSRLAANPAARLLVVTQHATQEAASRRGEMERAFLEHAGEAGLFEFSLGIPLSQVALAKGAYLILRWLAGPLAENELDWLLSTGQAAASREENAALLATMREMRRRGLERTAWTTSAFLGQRLSQNKLPLQWMERMRSAIGHLDRHAGGPPQSPFEWAAIAIQTLEAVGWPGFHPLSSAGFQAIQRWQQALDACGSLGFDGRRVGWRDFLAALGRTLDETLFVPESRNAPILIAGPAESAGLGADAVWFLGADEDAWPPGGSTHPLLPLAVQREAGMPHTSPQLDWGLANVITRRLLASAPEVHFSHARQRKDTEARPSRLIAEFAGAPQPLPPELIAPEAGEAKTIHVEEAGPIAYPHVTVDGGAQALTAQSQCAFKGFATARLGAQDWEPAEAGLTAAQRGKLLHSVMHAVWNGESDGLKSYIDLKNQKDLRAFVAKHVEKGMRTEIPTALRERMPRRYLELEGIRLTGLVTAWLEFEAARVAFEVVDIEQKTQATVAGLTMKLRMDRVDRLNDGSLLVVDYKTGLVSPKAWQLPRPDDVQLPLYAGFALPAEEALGGLVFARIRPGDLAFCGHVGDARASLLAGLSGSHSLVKAPFGAEQLIDWRGAIEQLAKDFLAGRAEVNPRDYPKTCEGCGLQTLCRIGKSAIPVAAGENAGEQEAGDE